MEYSSPLAAMRPQPPPSWNRRDMPMPRSMYGNFSTYGPSSFDFRNMSMQPPQPKPVQRDYFTLRPTRGSSPTSSLTADLDANFHIDQTYVPAFLAYGPRFCAHHGSSPQAATPRRSLFTANIFKPVEDLGE